MKTLIFMMFHDFPYFFMVNEGRGHRCLGFERWVMASHVLLG